MTSESISIPLGGTDFLSGEYRHCAARPGFVVLWAHGFGSHRGGEKVAAVAAECARRDWAFAAFDFRGHGASTGSMLDLRAGGLLADLAAARHFLAGRGHARIGLIGSSMGGFAAAWSAAGDPEAVVGCVLLAPAFGFLRRRWERLTEAERSDWERTGRLRVKNDWVDTEVGYGMALERDKFRVEDLAAAWRTPTLIFHGVEDMVVPDADSLDFVRRVRYPHVEVRLFRDGDHRLTAYKDEIAAEAGRFFARRLGAET